MKNLIGFAGRFLKFVHNLQQNNTHFDKDVEQEVFVLYCPMYKKVASNSDLLTYSFHMFISYITILSLYYVTGCVL